MAHGPQKAGPAGEGWMPHGGEREAQFGTGSTKKTLAELTAEATAKRAGRRQEMVTGGEEIVAAAKLKAARLGEQEGVILGQAERGISEAMASQIGSGPTDLRALAGTSTEARAAAAGAIQEAQVQQAIAEGEIGGSKMDVAKAIEEMGSEAEDMLERKKEWTAAYNQIIKAHKGFWDDDEFAMRRDILDMISGYPADDPLVIEMMAKAEPSALDKV